MSIIARHLMITGRVQGVLFRAWTVETARGLGLTGWVRNRLNGSVEAVVQGEEEAVTAFLDQAWTGPPAAQVADLAISEYEPGDYTGFEKRATA